MIRLFVIMLLMCLIPFKMLLSQPVEHQDLKWAIPSNVTYTVKFTNDGKNLITAEIDGNPKIWDVESGQMIKQYHGMNIGITKLDVSKDHKYIAAVNDLGEITIWNLYEGDIVKKITDIPRSTRKYHSNNIFFSNNCEYLISKVLIASDEGTFRWLAIWSTKNWELIKKIQFQGHSIAISKNDSLLAIAGEDNGSAYDNFCVGIYEFPTLIRVAETPPTNSKDPQFSPDGKYLISQNFGGYRKWNINDWNLEGYYGLADDTDFGYAISSDGNYLIGFGLWSKFSVVIDLNDGQIFNVYKNNYINNESSIGLSYDISNDMKYIAVGARNGVYVLNPRWETTSVNENHFGKSEPFIYPNPTSDFITIQFSNKGLQPFATEEKVQIFDMLGIELMSDLIHPITGSHRMNVEKLPAGMYFIRIGARVEKFVKM